MTIVGLIIVSLPFTLWAAYRVLCYLVGIWARDHVEYDPRGGKLRKGKVTIRKLFRKKATVYHKWGNQWVEFPTGRTGGFSPYFAAAILDQLRLVEERRKEFAK